MSQGTYSTVNVANGGTQSTGYRLKGANRGSFLIPAAFTGTNCKVQVAIAAAAEPELASSAWTDLPVEGNEAVTQTVAVEKSYAFHVKTFNFDWLRFVVDAQGAARSITIFTRD